MRDRIETLVEEFDGLTELRDEWNDAFDYGNIEAREIWYEIEKSMNYASASIRRIPSGSGMSEALVAQLENELEKLNDLFHELISIS